MRVRRLVVAGTAALALGGAGGVSTAPPPSGASNCGLTNSIAGQKWAIQASHISCSKARGVIRQLATRKALHRCSDDAHVIKVAALHEGRGYLFALVSDIHSKRADRAFFVGFLRTFKFTQ
jgi:hypothetical protein